MAATVREEDGGDALIIILQRELRRVANLGARVEQILDRVRDAFAGGPHDWGEAILGEAARIDQ